MARETAAQKAARLAAEAAENDETENETEKAVLLADDTFTGESISPALAAFCEQHEISIENAEAKLHVYKIEVNGDEPGVWIGDVDEYNLQTIAREFGSGKYRLKLYVRKNGRKPCIANKVYPWKLTKAEQAAFEAPIALPDAKPQNDIAALAGVMVTGFQQMGELIAKAVARPVEKDPMQTMEGIAKLAEILKPAQVAPVPKERTIFDSLKEFGAMKEMASIFSPGAKLVDDDGTVSTNAVIMKGIEAFTKAVDQAKANGGAKPATPALTAPEQQHGETAPESEQEAMFIQMAIKRQISQGVQLAKAGAEPDEYARDTYDAMPEANIIEFCADADWLANLAKFDERVTTHAEWFKKVRDAIVSFAVEDELIEMPVSGSVARNADKSSIPGAGAAG